MNKFILQTLLLLIKNNMLLINEHFISLQGEGQFAGHPMMFIRLSGCTRACSWCDTKYHKNVNIKMEARDLANLILKSKIQNVCFTGGEPLLQLKEVVNTIKLVSDEKMVNFHLESNGDLLDKDNNIATICQWFDYMAFSPKELKTCKKVYKIRKDLLGADGFEIKVVTDLKKEGVDMLKYATMLMPLTSYNEAKDKKTMQRVWEYCVQNNKIFSSRLQYIVFGKKMSV